MAQIVDFEIARKRDRRDDDAADQWLPQDGVHDHEAGRDRRVTYYVALPFVCDPNGELSAGEAVEFQTPRSAIAAAQVMASKHSGAVAFSRTGDPTTGTFDDAVVLLKVGNVPSELMVS